MSKRNPAPPPPALTGEILSHRRGFERFVLDHGESWHREHLGRLFTNWRTWNSEHFEGRLEPPYVLLAEPSTPRAYGDCGPLSGFGGRSQIRIRPSLVRGSHPHVRPDERFAEGRRLFVDDILLHEMVHQWQFEVLGDSEPAYSGHGPLFRDMANRIGAALGLGKVRDCKRRGADRDLPSCSFWPHVVRPEDYYRGALRDDVCSSEDVRSVQDRNRRGGRRRVRANRRRDNRWRAGLDVAGASPEELRDEIARLVATVVPRVSLQDAAALLASIDTAVLAQPPFADLRSGPPGDRVDLLVERRRLLEVRT